MIYFTADLHLGHEKIIEYCNRPFKSLQEMDETIIHNWNSVIKNDDLVYFLGDFHWGNTSGFRKYADRLNGSIYFIPGSHDNYPTRNAMISRGGSYFSFNEPIMEIYPKLKDEYGKDRLIVLCHYSMRSWNKSHYASYHLFGHHHGRLEPYGLSFDIGVDTNNFFPYSLDDIEKKMKTLKPIVDFRKGKQSV
jgi:calcineurin-like phosphoesterase family protein